LFVHLTASAVAIVTVDGEKAVDVILTVLVTLAAGSDAPVRTSAAPATASRTSLRMLAYPLVGGVCNK